MPSGSNLLFVHVADIEKQWLEIEKRFASPFSLPEKIAAIVADSRFVARTFAREPRERTILSIMASA